MRRRNNLGLRKNNLISLKWRCDMTEEANCDKSSRMYDRIVNLKLFEEPDGNSRTGYFSGRPIIVRDTPINGGVYIGTNKREAIVVDDRKYPIELNVVYEKVISIRKNFPIFKKGLLRTVHEVVMDVLKYDESRTYEIIGNDTHDKKISINAFLMKGVGVCRHQALLGGYILERCIHEGLIRGKVSVDRNSIRGRGGHAWTRYVNSKSQIFIIDPAQNYFGLLSEVPESAWFYKRSHEV